MLNVNNTNTKFSLNKNGFQISTDCGYMGTSVQTYNLTKMLVTKSHFSNRVETSSQVYTLDEINEMLCIEKYSDGEFYRCSRLVNELYKKWLVEQILY